MPTTAKRIQFHKGSLKCFQAQTYPHRELLVGSEDVAALESLSDAPGVRTIHVPHFKAIGGKRNWINRHAHGSLILHWDDDDWYYPGRIEEMVHLFETNPAVHVAGYRTCLFDGINGKLLFRAPGDYVVGSSLAYRISWWRDHPFPDGKHVGEDNDFIRPARQARVLKCLPGDGKIVARDHGMNTSPRNISTAQWSKWVGPMPEGYK